MRKLILLFGVAVLFNCHSHSKNEIEAKIDRLLAKMTLEEKVGQLQQYTYRQAQEDEYRKMIAAGTISSFMNVDDVETANRLQRWAVEESRLGIPLIFGKDVIHGYRTIYPIPLAEAASWDTALVRLAAAMAAKEARANGTHWTFAPMVDIARDPRWGRIAEGAGEDPVLGAAMAIAKVKGFQGADLNAPDRIVACVKHFVGYGAAEGGRDYNTTEISERTLREIYLPPFAAAVCAGVGTVMSAFNDLNGVPASANSFTLTQILRKEWGFAGFVVSDWNAIGELIPHGFAADPKEAGYRAFKAGVDMDMEGNIYKNVLGTLIQEGKIQSEWLDTAVRRILRIKYLLGLFDHPYVEPTRKDSVTLTAEHLSIARQLARESIVLLKNDNGLLPLSKKIATLAVVGPLANRRGDLLGTWSCLGRAEEVVSVLEGIKTAVAKHTQVLYDSACGVTSRPGDESGILRAANLARRADVVIAVVGESADMSGEAASRAIIDLPGNQLELLKALKKTGKPLVAVVLAGRPLTIPWEAEHLPAILYAWHGGVQAGAAVADVIFGDYNPSGRLPVSFPRSVGQIPLYYNHKNTGRPASDDKFTSKYLDITNEPLYPFGFGLSYSRFEYEDIQLSKTTLRRSENLYVHITVKNVGPCDGEEVVQLYVRDLCGSTTRPVKELKHFQRVSLKSGQSTQLQFIIEPNELAFYDENMKKIIEAGAYKVFIGPNSQEGKEAGFVLD